MPEFPCAWVWRRNPAVGAGFRARICPQLRAFPLENFQQFIEKPRKFIDIYRIFQKFPEAARPKSNPSEYEKSGVAKMSKCGEICCASTRKMEFPHVMSKEQFRPKRNGLQAMREAHVRETWRSALRSCPFQGKTSPMGRFSPGYLRGRAREHGQAQVSGHPPHR